MKISATVQGRAELSISVILTAEAEAVGAEGRAGAS